MSVRQNKSGPVPLSRLQQVLAVGARDTDDVYYVVIEWNGPKTAILYKGNAYLEDYSGDILPAVFGFAEVSKKKLVPNMGKVKDVLKKFYSGWSNDQPELTEKLRSMGYEVP
jgi:hypothetical protein